MSKSYVVEVVIQPGISDACASFSTKEEADSYRDTLQARNPNEQYFVTEYGLDLVDLTVLNYYLNDKKYYLNDKKLKE